jgi:nitroreductase
MTDPHPNTPFDLIETDRLLSTTRSVRRRLDLDRPVKPDVLIDCIRLSQQAPTGSNNQGWRWVIVTDPAKRAALAELYRAAGIGYLERQSEKAAQGSQLKRVMGSAVWLAQNLEKVPVHVIPCIEGRLSSEAPAIAWAGQMGSIFPAVWSFQLALRSRGLGSVLTGLHLASEQKAAELLGIPDDVMQVALLPVAYTKGTDFRPAERPAPETIVHWDAWGNIQSG